jgi:hypothetical protein
MFQNTGIFNQYMLQQRNTQNFYLGGGGNIDPEAVYNSMFLLGFCIMQWLDSVTIQNVGAFNQYTVQKPKRSLNGWSSCGFLHLVVARFSDIRNLLNI